MKKLHLILIIGIAIAIAVIASSMGNLSTYESFDSALRNTDKKVTVVAKLDLSQPIVHDPKVDANVFTFHAIDENQVSRQVKFLGNKPTDFERSEQLVMTGKMQGDVFVCDKIQMKCPSKYESDQVIEAKKPI